MNTVIIKIMPSNIELEVKLANTFFLRLKGLIGHSAAFPLLIFPCRQIHTCLMKFSIDVVYLDRNFTCLDFSCNVPAWKICPTVKDCFFILELPAGFLSKHNVDKKSEFFCPSLGYI